MEIARDLDVIRLAARARTDGCEFEPDHVAGTAPHTQLPALDLELVPGTPRFTGDGLEPLVELELGRRVGRGEVERCLLELPQPVVGARIDVDDLGRALEQRDRRQESRALQTIAI